MNGSSLVKITDKIKTISDMSSQIVTGAEEQAYATGSINKSIATISMISQGISIAATTNSDDCEQMELLRQLVSQFKLGDTLDMSNAKSAHLAWKGRIFAFLHGKESLSLGQAVSHRDCVLGKWYYSEWLQKYSHIPEMREIEKPHEELHKLIRQIIQLKQEGKNSQAEEFTHKIGPISNKICALLDSIEIQVYEQ